GHWTMDSKDGSNSTYAYDISGYNNDGTSITSGTFTNEGRFKEGYDFDNGYITVPNDESLKPEEEITVSAWIKPILENDREFIATKWHGFSMELDSEDHALFSTYIDGGQRYSGDSTALPNNTWTHLTGVYSNADQTMRIYVNGIEKNSTQLTGLSTYNMSVDDTDLRIGSYSTYTWDGMIDEVRIYNRALSSDEILDLYQGSKSHKLELLGDPTLGLVDETGLKGYWTFDSSSGSNATNATDSSGQGNHGNVSSAIFTNEGRFKEAYSFDGNNDYIDLGGNKVNIPDNQTWTFSAWVKAKGFDSYQGIYGNTLSGSEYERLQYKDDVTTFYWSDKSNTGGGTDVTWSGDLGLNKWYHVALVCDGTESNNLELYLDSTSLGKQTSTDTETTIRRIGSRGSTSANLWNGTIDEVRVYNRSLSASEVENLYSGAKTNEFQWWSVIG
ncbi:hypothetical protein GF358_01405, partial [Candidatus Woesearchaeota archaeon]|nr:hypothetical protein [Candidatus Woesearchaeota archaeon]